MREAPRRLSPRTRRSEDVWHPLEQWFVVGTVPRLVELEELIQLILVQIGEYGDAPTQERLAARPLDRGPGNARGPPGECASPGRPASDSSQFASGRPPGPGAAAAATGGTSRGGRSTTWGSSVGPHAITIPTADAARTTPPSAAIVNLVIVMALNRCRNSLVDSAESKLSTSCPVASWAAARAVSWTQAADGAAEAVRLASVAPSIPAVAVTPRRVRRWRSRSLARYRRP